MANLQPWDFNLGSWHCNDFASSHFVCTCLWSKNLIIGILIFARTTGSTESVKMERWTLNYNGYDEWIILCISWISLSCRYKAIKEVGDGTFGNVWRAISKQSGEVVCFLRTNRLLYLLWITFYYSSIIKQVDSGYYFLGAFDSPAIVTVFCRYHNYRSKCYATLSCLFFDLCLCVVNIYNIVKILCNWYFIIQIP